MSGDTKDLTPATAEEIAESLAYALRFDGRKRIHGADELMAHVTALHLVKHLQTANFVIMKGPPNPPPDTGRFSRPDKK